MRLSGKQKAGLGAAVVVAAGFSLFPEVGGMTSAGMKTAGLLIAFLLILVTEALPVIVTSLIFCGLMPLLGVTKDLNAALSGYSQPIVFFTLASFGIAAALTKIPVSQRILRKMLTVFGKDINSVLLAMMTACAAFSSIVSNVPTCAIFMTIALDFLNLYEDEQEKRKSGRAFMIAIPISSMIGGMMTPVGSSVNLIAIAQLEAFTGSSISFVQWACAGIPLALLMIPLAWRLIVRIYRPVPVAREQIQRFVDSISRSIPDKLGIQEKKVLIIIGIMLILWISSSWVPLFNVMIVATLGCCVMFLPGIEVLDVDTFLRENSWDAFFLVGTVLSISSAMIENGVSDVIAGLIPELHLPAPLLIAFAVSFIFISLIVIPVATSLIPILSPTLIAVALGAGVSPALIMISAAFAACNCYLLPLDTVPLITFSKGYYSMTDMMKSTIFMQLALVVLCALWVPVVGRIFGFL